MWDVDFMHPVDPGMAAIADMAVHLLQSTAMGLLLHPLGRQDKELLQEPLPPPMHAGERGCTVRQYGSGAVLRHMHMLLNLLLKVCMLARLYQRTLSVAA
jgi:hypothetical protein